jgi:hypothetical protein
MCALIRGWLRCSDVAAPVIEPSSATARNEASHDSWSLLTSIREAYGFESEHKLDGWLGAF